MIFGFHQEAATMEYLTRMVLRGAAPQREAKKHAALRVGLKCPVCFVVGTRRLVFRVGSILRRAYGTFQTHPNPGHYSDRLLGAALDAVRTRGQFNIIHPESGLKIDVIIPAENSFNVSRFDRARRIEAGNDLEACFASPEDAIIKKLEYYQLGGSDKHLRDIAGILKVSRGQIDMEYINTWATALGVGEIWTAALRSMTTDQ